MSRRLGRRFRLSVALCIAAILVAERQPIAAQSSDALDGFDTFVRGVMAEWRVPGLAVGVIKDGKVVLATGYGFRDVEKQLPVTPQTLMAIGSNTKSFTVTLLGMLSDEGKLDWDNPVRTYLPDFALHDDVASRLMTPTDLVTHRSGLPRHDLLWYPATLTRKELYERLRFLEPSATLRQRYQYNNLMFMTAGHLAERVTGRSWGDLIDERIFTPLGMNRSSTTVRDLPQSGDHALPYLERGGRMVAVPYRNIDAIAPAGSINSNVDEMLRYIQMHIDEGRVSGKALVSKRFTMLMQSPHSAMPGTIDLDAPVYTEMGPAAYGLGVAVRSYRGHKLVDHTGGIDGFISAMSWMPHDRLGVVVLSNSSGVNPVPSLVMLNLYDRVLGLTQVDGVSRTRAALERSRTQGVERERKRQAERVTGTSPSRGLAQLAGTYEHPAYGTLAITPDGANLKAALGAEVMTFEHFHYDVFQEVRTPDTRDWDLRRRMSFAADTAGAIRSVALPLEPAVADIVFTRKAAKPSATQ